MTGIKLVALLRRKPGTTFEQFREYYETRHAPLVTQYSPTMQDYRRNYLNHEAPEAYQTWQRLGIDVITEAWFATQEDYDAYLAADTDPVNAAMFVEDELNFLDRDAIVMFTVEERRSIRPASTNPPV